MAPFYTLRIPWKDTPGGRNEFYTPFVFHLYRGRKAAGQKRFPAPPRLAPKVQPLISLFPAFKLFPEAGGYFFKVRVNGFIPPEIKMHHICIRKYSRDSRCIILTMPFAYRARITDLYWRFRIVLRYDCRPDNVTCIMARRQLYV